jgi:hypothetical protein
MTMHRMGNQGFVYLSDLNTFLTHEICDFQATSGMHDNRCGRKFVCIDETHIH